MEKIKQVIPEFVVCIDNSEFPASLELHKIYRVIPDTDAAGEGDVRIVDESGEDYLYSSSFFVSIQVPQQVEESLMKAVDSQ